MAAGRLIGGSRSKKQAQPHRGHQYRVPLVSFIKRSSLWLFQPSLYNFITKPELISAALTDAAHSVSFLRFEVELGSRERYQESVLQDTLFAQFRGGAEAP